MKAVEVKTITSQSFPAFCTSQNHKKVAQMTPHNKLKWLLRPLSEKSPRPQKNHIKLIPNQTAIPVQLRSGFTESERSSSTPLQTRTASSYLISPTKGFLTLTTFRKIHTVLQQQNMTENVAGCVHYIRDIYTGPHADKQFTHCSFTYNKTKGMGKKCK